ncbi:MAG: aspartate aminotransferase family protein, partial [Rhodobacteraceae bacterium]
MRRAHPENHNLLLESLGSASDRFIANNPKSLDRWEKASKVLPGGNTRTVLHYDPFPITIQSGNGTYLKSIDGDSYTDFLGEYSAGLYGHSNP